MATYIFDNEGNYDLMDAEEMTLNDVFKAGAYLMNLAAAGIMYSNDGSTRKEKEIILKTVLSAFNDAMNNAYFADKSDEVGVVN